MVEVIKLLALATSAILASLALINVVDLLAAHGFR
jgi:hypothetical protein